MIPPADEVEDIEANFEPSDIERETGYALRHTKDGMHIVLHDGVYLCHLPANDESVDNLARAILFHRHLLPVMRYGIDRLGI